MADPLPRIAVALALGFVLVGAPRALAAASAPPLAGQGGRALAHALGADATARFRSVRAHGDVVCGEIASRGGGWTPFYAYADGPRWTAHAATDGRALAAGLRCFDRGTRLGPDPAWRAAVCKTYDFSFYFAYDHFCR